MIVRTFKTAAKVLVLVFIAVVAASVYFASPRPLRYSIVFDSAEGVRPGAPLRLGDHEIGRVDRVEILEDGRARVTVSVDSDYRQQVRSNSTAVVAGSGKPGAERAVDVHNLDASSPPISPGAEVEGTGSWVDLQVKLAREKGKEWFLAVSRQLDDIMQKLSDMGDTEDLQQLRQRAAALAESMGDWAHDHYGELREQYPEVQEQMQRIYQRAKDLGEEGLAQILENIVRLLASSPAPTPTPEAG